MRVKAGKIYVPNSNLASLFVRVWNVVSYPEKGMHSLSDKGALA